MAQIGYVSGGIFNIGCVSQDPKILEEIKILKEKDRKLSMQVKAAEREKIKFDRERKVLLKEIKKMRKDPASTEGLKKQIRRLIT